MLLPVARQHDLFYLTSGQAYKVWRCSRDCIMKTTFIPEAVYCVAKGEGAGGGLLGDTPPSTFFNPLTLTHSLSVKKSTEITPPGLQRTSVLEFKQYPNLAFFRL